MDISSKNIFRVIWGHSAGATLLEVVVTITILGVALPAGFALLSNAYVQYTESRVQQQAFSVAQKYAEALWAYRNKNVYWYQEIENQFNHPVQEGKFTVSYHVRKERRGKARVWIWKIDVVVSHPELRKPVVLTVFWTRYVGQ